MTPAMARPQQGPGFQHVALLYDDDAGYASAVRTFLEAAPGRPAFVAVPEPRLALLRRELAHLDDLVEFAEMGALGGNPGRIIPALRGFVDDHPDGNVRAVGESAWAARSDAAMGEVMLHEALSNEAFADADAGVLCPYDVNRLSRRVIADVRRTHPLMHGDGQQASSDYGEPLPGILAAWPLEPPPDTAEPPVPFEELTATRRLVHRHALEADLDPHRYPALLVAVEELCSNTLEHGPGEGTLQVWSTDESLICQVHDAGYIADPLAGRRRPQLLGKGSGLFIVHHMCDLVQVRSSPEAGTTVRVHLFR